MVKTKRKEKAKWLLTIGAVVMSAVALVSSLFGLAKNETTENVTNSMYAVGTINETGKIVESKKSAYMKNAQTTEDLTIDIDEETATITYKVVYYDEDEKFLSMTESLAEDLDTSTIPETAKYFRVVVTPDQVDEEDVTLNMFNKAKYTSQLEITFAK